MYSKKNFSILVAVMLFSTVSVAYGHSSDKLKKVQNSYSALVELVNQTTSLVETAAARDLLDNAAIEQYNALVNAVNEFGEIDLASANNAELDFVLEKIGEMEVAIANYQETVGSVFIQKVQDDYSELVELVNQTTSLVETAAANGLLNDEVIGDYNTFVNSINEFGAIDLNKATSEELGIALEEIEKWAAELIGIKEQIEGLF